ncbi:ATP-binding protein [Anaerotignum sp.]|uniref:ATP-binding protein n=1 Tax=Anaerotignum sp. TaxID=2039241 RepID=UPI00289B479E|nr:4Fe-4S binding protein [Anaerotignum sp.]
MKKLAKINLDRCPQNHRCPSLRACPVGALTQQSPYSAPVIDEALCIGCGKCAIVCPRKALIMVKEG